MKSIKSCSAFTLAVILTSIIGYGTAMAAERMDIAAGGGQTAGEYVDDAMITTKVAINAATEVAQRVGGVKSVKNNLQLKNPLSK